ncbi:hypothetical protein [Mucisphaera calidilacus]|uniref:ResB-like domain-containing protein n=1 Tax=Mucisphaera calidilacus TaxID=2527982 RepID=A0A518BYP1_9BACT|nr:hypothetical protein [Mucisphaera calidilacus]QDU72091.1 hypothetical protein Pan265_19530 [Mucisphaera calidilacus]
MSLKYRRIKEHDLALPAPLRWLTRAFSSIRLAVALLLLISLYGTLASVPVGYLVIGAAYLAIALAFFGPPAAILAITQRNLPTPLVIAAWIAIALAGSWLTYLGSVRAYDVLTHTQAWNLHGRTLIYQLPGIEMTELQFYSWWPMQLILMLFVVNMIWATIRRIEFNLPNLGVLTVHTGIVVLTLGAILYSSFKVEGDIILFRRDLGGGYEKVFYDAVDPALFVTVAGHGRAMIPLDDLPRYNDYPAGTLDINFAQRPDLEGLFPAGLSLRVIGFHPDAEIGQVWALQPDDAPDATILKTSPALRLGFGNRELTNPDELPENRLVTLASGLPADRYTETHLAAIELIADISDQRAQALMTDHPGEHLLIIEVPADNHRQVNAITPGQTIDVADTGYRLTVAEIGPYGIPFVTPGYEDAEDTRALVEVEGPTESYRRIVMHRFPERSQDFVPRPDDPSVGPMGQRRDPAPDIRITYLDRSKPQFRILWSPDQPDAPMELIANLPGSAPLRAPLAETRFPIARNLWVHLLQASRNAALVRQPVVKPREQRDPSDIGNYTTALLLVEVTTTSPLPDDRQILMLHHMRYPRYPSDKHQPETLTIPSVGDLTLSFSRREHILPFGIALSEFEMTPYPDTHPPVPRDFSSSLLVGDLHPEDRTLMQQPDIHAISLNNPAIVRTPTGNVVTGKLKLSQVGWDPGDTASPNHEAVGPDGRFLNQQRFSIVGISNNVGIRIIFIGSCLIVAGVPWAFYVKPWMIQRRKKQLAQQHAPTTPEPQHA